MNFNNILIGSEDPQRLVDYYTKVFGKPAMAEAPANHKISLPSLQPALL